MRQNLSAVIALRYLLSKKTHGAVATITTVSVCAMAVATAAIICVLSVFNGFKREIGLRLDSLSPDVEITPAKGKTFANTDSLLRAVGSAKGVDLATPTLSDNALIIYNGSEMPVKVKGVDPAQYAGVTSVRKLIPEGYGRYIDTAVINATPALLSIGVAARMSAYPDSRMLIFAPRRSGRVNLANPAASFLTDSLTATGIYRSDQSQYDEDGVILPIEAVRRLLLYDNEASAIEVRAAQGTDPATLASSLSDMLGPACIVKDRMRQQEMNFRMIQIEKWISFMLLGFILVIASFNIFSSMSMLVLEKEDSLSTLSALGMSRKQIGSVFAWESIYVSAAGGIAGVTLGLILCLIQQHFGLIKIGADPSAVIVTAYPVEVQVADIFLTLLPIALIGAVTALAISAFAKSRINRSI